MSTKGTNPRGITLKDELRRRLEVARAEAALWQGRYDDVIAAIDRDVLTAFAKGCAFGVVVGGLVGWWLA